MLVGVMVALSFVMMQGCNRGKEKATGQRLRPMPKVDAWVVAYSTVVNEISVSGSLLPFEEVQLKNEIPGRIVELNLTEGASVKKGTLLVKIYDADLQASRRKMEAQLAIQKQILERQGALLEVSGISQNEYDQTLLQVNSIKAEIEVVDAQIRKTEILAPFDGVIGLRNVSLGAVVTTSTHLASLRMEKNLKLDFSVPEKYSGMIHPGLNVTFTVQSDREPHHAVVIATEQGIDAATRNLRVRAAVYNPPPTLIAGAFANVQLALGENNKALMVPTQAIIPQERKKSLIIARSGKAFFQDVETGIRTAGTIEIIRGVQPGDTVITSGVLFLKEGAKLDYSSINTAAL